MYFDWGLNKFYECIDYEFDDECGYVIKLIECMLFLEGMFDMMKCIGFKVGKDVFEMLESDLCVEYEVDVKLCEVIVFCEIEKDYVICDMLIVLLDDIEMDYVYWLE